MKSMIIGMLLSVALIIPASATTYLCNPSTQTGGGNSEEIQLITDGQSRFLSVVHFLGSGRVADRFNQYDNVRVSQGYDGATPSWWGYRHNGSNNIKGEGVLSSGTYREVLTNTDTGNIVARIIARCVRQ